MLISFHPISHGNTLFNTCSHVMDNIKSLNDATQAAQRPERTIAGTFIVLTLSILVADGANRTG